MLRIYRFARHLGVCVKIEHFAVDHEPSFEFLVIASIDYPVRFS